MPCGGEGGRKRERGNMKSGRERVGETVFMCMCVEGVWNVCLWWLKYRMSLNNS